jgi:hypothetical protein
MISPAESAPREPDIPLAEHAVPLRYLIASQRDGRLTLLTLADTPRGNTLPVFDTRQAAHEYLRLGGLVGWRVRESTVGELVSLLLGPLAGVERVLVSPSPERDALEDGVGKKEFVAALLGEPLLVGAC